jgi:hypothetical protein
MVIHTLVGFQTLCSLWTGTQEEYVQEEDGRQQAITCRKYAVDFSSLAYHYE